jgi:hypothetical protein
MFRDDMKSQTDGNISRDAGPNGAANQADFETTVTLAILLSNRDKLLAESHLLLGSYFGNW